jgi:Fe-S-cluster containining protein
MQELVQITRLSKSEFHETVRELDRQKRILEPQLSLRKLSKYIAERLATPETVPVPECVTCGACCAFALIVPISVEESERLDQYLEITLDGAEPPIAIDRMLPRNDENGHCINLAGNIGENIGCTIYEKRPHVCRDFDPGSDRCHEYRRMYRVEPQLTETAAAAAIERLGTRTYGGKIEDVSIVEDSRVMHAAISEDGVEYSETVELKLYAFLEDETPRELHCYDPAKEIWFENELVGYTLDEASEIIAVRSAKIGQ